jgi:uncharacterized iron-regulated membrane protein
MRAVFVLLHRYAGLLIAGFLFVSGVTGAVISWDHELDDLLNTHLTEARSDGPARPALELARELEQRHPQVMVTFVPLAPEPGKSLAFGVSPRLNPATGRLYEPGFNQVFVDAASGAELGRREWGSVWPITKENLVSFLYVLHYSLHIPEMWGIDRWGIWLLGVIAIIWTLDCFVGFYLTLPRRRRAAADDTVDSAPAGTDVSWWRRWKPAWKVRWCGGPYKLNFDLHRAFSLWTWLLLFIVAFTAFSLNLYREIFLPLMSTVSQVTPTPFEQRTPTALHEPIEPRKGYAEVIALAGAEAQRRGWDEPVGSVFYTPNFGVYGVQLFHPGADHGTGGVGHTTLYFDGEDGRVLGARQPWRGTAADIFVQAQFPLHSGRILGIPGRILISLMGLVVAMLSVTGVYIWWKKRRSRQRAGVARPHAAALPAKTSDPGVPVSLREEEIC